MLTPITTDSSGSVGELRHSGVTVSGCPEEVVDPDRGVRMRSLFNPGCGVDEKPPCASTTGDGWSCCDFWMGDTPGVGPVIDAAEPGLTVEELTLDLLSTSFSICPGNGLSANTAPSLCPFSPNGKKSNKHNQ